MEILIVGGGFVLLVFWMTGNRQYETAIKQMEDEPERATSTGCWAALSLVLLGIAVFGVVSMLAMMAKGI